MKKQTVETIAIQSNGGTVEATPIKRDTNGNPRAVVHFSQLNIEHADYGKIKGLTKYRGKDFGGGYVFQTHDAAAFIAYAKETAAAYYHKKANAKK